MSISIISKIALGLVTIIGIYLWFLIKRIFRFFHLFSNKIVVNIVSALIAIVVAYSCRNVRSMGMLVIIHLFVISVVIDIIALIVRVICYKKQGKNNFLSQLYRCSLLPFVLTGIVLIYGNFNMNHIVKTQYQIQTEKNIGNYKVVMITDIHYATIQDTEILKNTISEINEENPDIVVFGGDIVEEGTTKEKMQEVFQVLGSIKSKYGLFYVYGNHDTQPYTQDKCYTKDELKSAILENNITILDDEYIEINEELVLVGRGDAALGNMSQRASTEELLEGVDKTKYRIVADHQPIEAAENAAQGVDLQISGHTHAGQIWPIGYFTEWLGGLNYGQYQEGNCNIIVTSGFTGWGYSFRTQEHCEYVVVEIG